MRNEVLRGKKGPCKVAGYAIIVSMKPWQRVLYYLLINVVVSAVTTLIVLGWWERTHPLPTPAAVAPILPSPLPPTATPWPTSPPTRALTVYVVQPGDSLSSIAARFGISVEELMALNALDNPNALGVGQQLFVPLVTTPGPTATATEPSQPGQVYIADVFAPGDLAHEGVLIRRTGGQGELSLEGWVLQEGGGQQYVFPRLVLFPGGAVSLFTQAGVDTVVELHWGATEALFESGETLTLFDADGQPVSQFRIP